MNLRSLPQISPPKDFWPAIAEGLDQPRRARLPVWAAAATIFAAVAIALVVWQQPSGETTLPLVAEHEAEQLDRLVAVSQQMETRLQAYREEVGVMTTTQAGMVSEFEDLIAFIDQQLSDHPGDIDLWFQRVSLISDLLGVYAVQQVGELGMIASL